MAGRYRLSQRAVADLKDIWRYSFKNWGQAQANNYYTDLLASVENLAAGLRKGLPVPERDGYLKATSGSHLIFYRTSDDDIEVIRILHQSMDERRHLAVD
ncbi:type II toxin-antitoxin system RelE/ParE family toxin [Asticcacaulis sp. EMRT-3]|uniref:type II toxin-antitoxin system RelE/ParE family toxin n=1 Tax=Asticcacaulis sp. EMRT-3 TaxID=3040349 RepID=UPI0024AEFE87|nr:type II toxin-antitoxin system RelE/ParE family toxin [Asticcacaulis sp. EMRT-3]MDI7776408.1 type II toxin-antitoxin system RelE/ParE family toxin [Asticcacaulis sp. EMRT-3]